MDGTTRTPGVMIRTVRRLEERLHRTFQHGYGARTALRTSVRRLDARFTEAGASKDSIRWLLRYVTAHEAETRSFGRSVYFLCADPVTSLMADMEEWIDRGARKSETSRGRRQSA